MKKFRLLLLPLLMFGMTLSVACTNTSPVDEKQGSEKTAGDKEKTQNSEVVADAGNDAGIKEDTPKETEPDIPTIGDVDNTKVEHRCKNKPVETWPLHGKVATGLVTGGVKDGVFEVTVDANAGGMQGARRNPFVYLDLDTGKKVEISDIKALTNKTWELAFKRVAVRSNGGDSGVGKVEIGKVSKSSFDSLKIIPNDLKFLQDRTFDDSCSKTLTDPIGTPRTVFNDLNKNNPSGSESWYSYGGVTAIQPVAGDVYIIRNTSEGKTYKFVFVKYKSASITVRWKELK